MLNNFKQDFGTYLKKTVSNNSCIQILQPFNILSLVMYPDKTSSLTVAIDDMIGSLDFDDDVLKVFVYVLRDLEEMGKGGLGKKMYFQEDEPIVINFNQQPLITGMVLLCNLKNPELSSATGEKFIPLNIQKAEVVQEPACVIVGPAMEMKVEIRSKPNNKPQPIDPILFPTLAKYDPQIIENKIQSLMKNFQMTRHQAMCNLDIDL